MIQIINQHGKIVKEYKKENYNMWSYQNDHAIVDTATREILNSTQIAAVTLTDGTKIESEVNPRYVKSIEAAVKLGYK